MSRWKGIKTIEYGTDCEDNLVIGLGFFDCLHIGHIKLIGECKRLANKYACKSAIFTFENSPFVVLNKDVKQVLDFEERLFKLNELQVDYCIKAHFDKNFSQLGPEEFLNGFVKNKKVKALVAGSDYTFGKNGAGGVDFLKKWCVQNGIELSLIEFATDNGVKISSTSVRKLLSEGNLKKANVYLGGHYFVIGNVEKGRKEGKNIGFATANLIYPDDKIRIKDGVYYTRVLVDGVWYKAVTNVGNHPTFEDYNFNIESHILYYDNVLYGKKIVVIFIEYIREIKKFSSKEELAAQIAKDVKFALESKE